MANDFNAKANFNPLITAIDKTTEAWKQYQTAQTSAGRSAGTFAKNGTKAATALDKMSGALARSTKGANTSATAFNKNAVAVNKTAVNTQKATKSTKELSVSMQGLARLGAFNLVSRGLSSLTTGLSQALTKAIEFEKKISAIRTISQQNQLSFSKWGDELIKISSNFNLDLLDTVGAAYQTISNQVASGADTFDFLTTAADLAITAQGTLSQSVDALSSVIKSYNLTTADAVNISAKLFKTAELGRVPLDSISDKIGTVTVIASKMGVSLDEVLASLATLTVQGVKPANAMTFLRNALNKTLKPTEAMKEAVANLGFESGEAALRSLGLIGFLGALKDQSSGTASEIAQLFGSIRATQFVMGATGKSADLFRDNLLKLKDATESYTNATEIARESAGFKFQKALNELSNALIKVQQVFLSVIVSVSEPIGGIQTLVFGLASAIVVALIPAVKALNFQLKLLTKGNVALFIVLTALEVIISDHARITKFWGEALGFAAEKTKELNNVTDADLFNQAAAASINATESLRAYSLQLVTTGTTARKQMDIIISKSQEFTKAFSKENLKDVQDQVLKTSKVVKELGSSIELLNAGSRAIVQAQGDEIDQAFAKLKTAREEIQKALSTDDAKLLVAAQKRERQALKSLAGIAKSSAKAVKDIQIETANALQQQAKDLSTLKDRLFIKEKKRQKELLDLNIRAAANSKLGQFTLGSVKNAKTLPDATLASSQRIDAIKQLESVAPSKEARNKLIDQRLREEELFIRKVVSLRNTATLEEFNAKKKILFAEADAIKKSISEQQNIIEKNLIEREKIGKRLEKKNAQIAANKAQVTRNPTRLFKDERLTAQRDELEKSDRFFFDANEKARDAIINLSVDLDLAAAEFATHTDKIIDSGAKASAASNANIVDQAKALTKSTKDRVDADDAAVNSLVAKLDIDKAAAKTAKEAELAQRANTEATKNNTAEKNKPSGSIPVNTGRVFGPESAPEEVSLAWDESFKKIDKVTEKSALEDRTRKNKAEEDAKAAAILAAQARSRAIGGVAQGLGSIGSVLEGTGGRINLAGIKAADFGAKTAKSARAIDGMTAAAQAFANTFIEGKKEGLTGKQKAGAILTGAASGAAIGATISGGNPIGIGAGALIGGGLAAWQVLQKGGQVQYREDGSKGPEQGTDTVPAMLTPGEFVMNRSATDKFLPQLRAMNDFRNYADGGRVENSNVTVGDININPTPSSDGKVDIVGLGNDLRQEIRNGLLAGIN